MQNHHPAGDRHVVVDGQGGGAGERCSSAQDKGGRVGHRGNRSPHRNARARDRLTCANLQGAGDRDSGRGVQRGSNGKDTNGSQSRSRHIADQNRGVYGAVDLGQVLSGVSHKSRNASPTNIIEAVKLPQVVRTSGKARQREVRDARADPVVVHGDGLQAIRVAAEDLGKAVLGGDPDAPRGAVELVRDLAVSPHLARPATLKPHPLTIVVEQLVENSAVALDSRLRIKREDLRGH